MNYLIRLIKSLKPHRTEHWMIVFILMYSGLNILKYILPQAITTVLFEFWGLSFLILIIKSRKQNLLTGATRLCYTLLVIWSIWLTAHALLFVDLPNAFAEYHGIQTYLRAFLISHDFLPNMMPFILLCFGKWYQFDFKYLVRVMRLLGICYLIYYPFSFWNMTHFQYDMTAALGEKGDYQDFISNSTLGIAALSPAVMMIYFKKYLPNKHWWVFMAAYIGNILLSAFMARRSGTAMSLLYLASVWFLYSTKAKTIKKIKMVIIAIIVLTLGYFIFTNAQDSFFSLLLERGDDDTRSGIENIFYADMDSIYDWIYGRGWFGSYYDTYYGLHRHGIETGYLTLILRGGFIYLFLYVAIFALSAFNGYFRSKNIFCKALAIILFIQILQLYPFGWPMFNLHFFICWLSVWICNNKTIRNMSDEDIKTYYFPNRFN